MRVKRPTEVSPLAPLEEALAASVSSISNRRIINPRVDVGPPVRGYLLGRLIHDNLTYLRGLYVIPEELTGVLSGGIQFNQFFQIANRVVKEREGVLPSGVPGCDPISEVGYSVRTGRRKLLDISRHLIWNLV